MPPRRLSSLGLEAPFGFVPRPPREDGVGEDVVEDLVVRPRRAVLAGTNDSFARQSIENAFGLGLVDSRIAGKVTRAVSDLRSGGRDEVVVHRRCGVTLLR